MQDQAGRHEFPLEGGIEFENRIGRSEFPLGGVPKIGDLAGGPDLPAKSGAEHAKSGRADRISARRIRDA